ncbi:alpha-2-macroglobulin family protein [Oscillospiraceae bacterium MB08-C2-2]|nr:alpha-2-macroglobulin family protein [Oscillospiraceae bacterium MB08-C2-2]
MKRSHKLISLLLAALLLLTACGDALPQTDSDAAPSGTRYSLDAALEGLRIEAEQADDTGVALESAFILTPGGELSQKALSDALELEPALPFSISQLKGGKSLLTLLEPMEPDKIYTFFAKTPAGTKGRTWAFQSRKQLRVVYTTPDSDRYESLPDTGIEVVFNYTDVDISQHFEITPPVRGSFLTNEERSAFVPDRDLPRNTRFRVTIKAGLPAGNGVTLAEDYSFAFVTGEPSTYEAKSRELEFFMTGSDQETFLTTDSPLLEISGYNLLPSLEFKVEAFPLTPSRYKDELLAFNRRHYDEAYKPDSDYTASTASLEPAVSFETAAVQVVSRYGYGNYPRYLPFPEPLPAGHYLVSVSAQDPFNGKTVTRQKLIQISDTSLFVQSLNGDGLAWLNDAANGQLLAKAPVELLAPLKETSIASVSTDDAGIARFQSGENTTALIHIPSVGEQPEYWDFLFLQETTPLTVAESYTAFTYTDRLLYKPTDTAQFWGILRGRREAIAAGTAVTIQLRSGNYYNWSGYDYGFYDNQAFLQSTEAVLEPDGTYIGSMKLENLMSGNYYLAVMAPDGRQVDYANFEVRNYEKPVYKTSTSSDKLFYLPGEQADINAHVSFFEGTPVWGLPLWVQGDFQSSQPVTLDATGTARMMVDPTSGPVVAHWAPTHLSYQFIQTGEGNVIPSIYGSFLYFPSDLILQVKQEGTSREPKITVSTNRLDTSRIESYGDIYQSYPDNFVGEAADTEVEVKITRYRSVKKPLGSYYDWASKRNVTTYTYESSESLYSSYTARTQNGTLSLSDLPAPNKEESYEVMVTAEDSRGLSISETTYLLAGWDTRRSYYEETSNLRKFYFSPAKDNDSPYYSYYDQPSVTYQAGEPIEFALTERQAKDDGFTGRVLYTAVQDKILEAGISQQATLSLEQAADFIPNVNISGAYFDGRYIYPVSSFTAAYDTAAEELEILVRPGASRYLPGEKASLSVEVKDKTGSPVEARVSLSIVDEAMFALGEQSLAPLDSLYARCYYRAPVTHESYRQHLLYIEEIGGKGGGGGDDMPRSDFPDTAQFLSLATDNKGLASLEFELPDSITSWRITAVAVEQEALRAGAGVSNIDCSLPLFVQPVFNEAYLSGDDVAISASCFGTSLTRSTPVRYTATLEPLETVEAGEIAFPLTLEIKGRTDRQTTLNFGKLPAGRYTLTLKAATNDGSDAVQHEIEVVESTLALPIVQEFTLGEKSTGLGITPAQYPILMGFADSQYQTFFRVSKKLVSDYGNRGDQRVAAIAAKRSMLRFMSEEDSKYLDFISEELGDYLLPDRDFLSYAGMRLYPYDAPDIALTAKTLALLGPDYPSAPSMREFLLSELSAAEYMEYLPEQIAPAYVGLATVGEPVLLKIRSLLADPAYNGDVSQLYLIAALALTGDQDGAREAFDTRFAPRLNEVGSNLYYRDQSLSDEDNYRLTALSLLACAAMNHPDTEGLARYLAETPSASYSPNLELGLYISRFQPVHSGSAALEYQKNGKAVKVGLKEDGIHYASFMAPDLAGESFRATRGEILATAYYMGSLEEYRQTQNPDSAPEQSSEGDTSQSSPKDSARQPEIASISRSIREASPSEITRFIPGGEGWDPSSMKGMVLVEITVEFTDQAPLGTYEITQSIPSPLRFEAYEPYNDQEGIPGQPRHWSWYTREKQSMPITLYRYLDYDPSMGPSSATPADTVTLQYLTRRVYAADFAAEDVFLLHPESGLTVSGATRAESSSGTGKGKRTF